MLHYLIQVYGSALRAQKRRQLQIRLRAEEAKSAPYQDRRKQALFNDFDVKMKRETSEWESEYSSHYRGYDNTEYARSLSARLDRKKPKPEFSDTVWFFFMQWITDILKVFCWFSDYALCISLDYGIDIMFSAAFILILWFVRVMENYKIFILLNYQMLLYMLPDGEGGYSPNYIV